LRYAIKKSSSFGEFGMSCALREIATERDQIGTVIVHAG
jgi:hypothetical protein